MQNISLFHLFIFEILSTSTDHALLWPCPSRKILNHLLIYVNLYQHKKKATSLICSGDMVDCKIVQSDWLRTFWPISQEQKFSQIWDLYRNKANNNIFHYRTNSVKITDQIFNKNSKNPIFGPSLVRFPNVFGKNVFPRKSCSVTHIFIWVSSTK